MVEKINTIQKRSAKDDDWADFMRETEDETKAGAYGQADDIDAQLASLQEQLMKMLSQQAGAQGGSLADMLQGAQKLYPYDYGDAATRK